MHLHEIVSGSVAVVALKGDLLDDADCLALQQKISSLRTDGIRNVVFDLSGLNRLNSKGLGALVRALKTMREAGGDIRCADIRRRINSLLVETRLVQLFRTFETVGRAQASFV